MSQSREPKSDEVFLRRMAQILRSMKRRNNQSSTQSDTTTSTSTMSNISTLGDPTSSSSANIEPLSGDFSEPTTVTLNSPQMDEPMSQGEIAAGEDLELPDAQSVLITCIDFVLRRKYGCARARNPEEERDRDGWPFETKFNPRIVEYFYGTELQFGVCVMNDRHGQYVFIQNLEKLIEYKVYCLDTVFIPTLDIYEDDGTETENSIKYKVELNKYVGIFDFVVEYLVNDFILTSPREQKEFCSEAVEFEATKNMKKAKFDETTHTEVHERLSAIFKELPNGLYLTPTVRLLGTLVEFLNDHIKCSIVKSSPWPVSLTYARDDVTFTINEESFSMSLTDIGSGYVLILRNDAYIFLTGRFLSKDIVPTFDGIESLENRRFSTLSAFINSMVDYLLLKKYSSRTASSSTPGTPQ